MMAVHDCADYSVTALGLPNDSYVGLIKGPKSIFFLI